MEMLTVNTKSNSECQTTTSISEASYDDFINALFDRAFGPYEVKEGGEDS